MTVLATIDTDALLQLAWAAPLAAITVALAFAVCIHGAARSADARRDGRAVAATAYGAMAVLAGIAFAGAVFAGLLVIVRG